MIIQRRDSEGKKWDRLCGGAQYTEIYKCLQCTLSIRIFEVQHPSQVCLFLQLLIVGINRNQTCILQVQLTRIIFPFILHPDFDCYHLYKCLKPAVTSRWSECFILKMSAFHVFPGSVFYPLTLSSCMKNYERLCWLLFNVLVKEKNKIKLPRIWFQFTVSQWSVHLSVILWLCCHNNIKALRQHSFKNMTLSSKWWLLFIFYSCRHHMMT